MAHSRFKKLFVRGGLPLRVEIILSNDVPSGWKLKVINEHGISFIWNDAFLTETAALDAFEQMIEIEGPKYFCDAAKDLFIQKPHKK